MNGIYYSASMSVVSLVSRLHPSVSEGCGLEARLVCGV